MFNNNRRCKSELQQVLDQIIGRERIIAESDQTMASAIKTTSLIPEASRKLSTLLSIVEILLTPLGIYGSKCVAFPVLRSHKISHN